LIKTGHHLPEMYSSQEYSMILNITGCLCPEI
jgi:hypothetical protein